MYGIFFLTLVVVTFFFSRNDKRSLLWLGVLTLSYLVTSVYHNLYAYSATEFAVGADVICCLAIYFLARETWELRLFRVFQLMCLINMFAALGIISLGTFYQLFLEALNYAALFGIALPGALDAAGHSISFKNSWLRHYIHGLIHTLRAKRTHPPFTERW